MRPAEESDLTTLKQPAKKTQWQKLNRMQKTGVISAVILICVAMPFSGQMGLWINLLGWTVFAFGYITGSLWKVRHALHFWWSVSVAFIAHCCVTPLYIYLIKMQGSGARSAYKAYMYLLTGLMCVEVVTFIFISKQIAVWLLKRDGRIVPVHHDKGPGSLLA